MNRNDAPPESPTAIHIPGFIGDQGHLRVLLTDDVDHPRWTYAVCTTIMKQLLGPEAHQRAQIYQTDYRVHIWTYDPGPMGFDVWGPFVVPRVEDYDEYGDASLLEDLDVGLGNGNLVPDDVPRTWDDGRGVAEELYRALRDLDWLDTALWFALERVS